MKVTGIKRCVDLFAGCAIWTSMMVLCGFLCEPVDAQLDAIKYKLLNESVVLLFVTLLRSGFYSVAHIATECTTFSRGTSPPYRTNGLLFAK